MPPIAEPGAQSFSAMFRHAGPSTLIIANLIPLLGAVLWGWSVGAIVTLYWAENLIIGGITLLKMFHLENVRALPYMAFLTMHYGMFCLGHGALLAKFIDSHPMRTGGGFGSNIESAPDVLFGPVHAIFTNASEFWVYAFTALLVSHVASLFANYFRRQEYLAESMRNLMAAPYKRIFVMHLVVVIGAIAAEELGSKIYLLVVLVIIKTLVDVYLHIREHQQVGYAYAQQDIAKPIAG